MAAKAPLKLVDKIKSKKAIIGVIGLGYVGMPLALEFAETGFKVIGVDRSRERIESLKKGKSYVEDIDSARLSEQIRNKKLLPTHNPEELIEADAILICVPTPLSKTKDPDLSHIENAVESIPFVPEKERLIVLESTTYPGTTEELVLPRFQKGGRKVGKDFYLVFSPERVDPGNKKYHTANIPKVIGGMTPECTRVATLLYGQIIEKVIPVSSTRVAEMVKLLENTFRSVNIGLVNEIALMCYRMGLDVWEVIDAAATKPFGFMPFYPGPGLGGHCLPVDPLYLSWKARTFDFRTKFIDLAAEVNGFMPRIVVSRIADLLNEHGKCVKGANILLLGMAYKKNVSDVRESPSLDIWILLKEKGAKLVYHDPYVPQIKLEGETVHSQKLVPSLLQKSDVAVILTAHESLDYTSVLNHSHLVFDTRNATKGLVSKKAKVAKL